MSVYQPVCVITGGSSGIGLATALQFAKLGYRVAICGRRRDSLEEAARKIGASIGSTLPLEERVMFHVANFEHIQQALDFGERVISHWGNIDVLVNNAAFAPLAAFEQIASDTFERTINTNVRSLFYLTQLVWDHLIRRNSDPSEFTRRGVIVNISSLAAVDPFPGFSIYGASKAWLDLLTHSLAAEGQSYGLRVYSVRPGAVETPMLRDLFPDFPANECFAPETIAELVRNCVENEDWFPSGSVFTVEEGLKRLA